VASIPVIFKIGNFFIIRPTFNGGLWSKMFMHSENAFFQLAVLQIDLIDQVADKLDAHRFGH